MSLYAKMGIEPPIPLQNSPRQPFRGKRRKQERERERERQRGREREREREIDR